MKLKQRLKKAARTYLHDLRELKFINFIMLIIAGTVNAFGVTVFLAPVKLYDSGASGTAMLISQLTPEWMTLSLVLLIINIPLFVVGLKKQGIVFTVYSVFAVGIYSLVAFLITDVLPIDVSLMSPIAEDDLLLCAIFGGLISGAGSGLTIRYGGAIDGVEVMAVIFSKKPGLSVGTLMMCYNVILYIICGAVMQSWILPLYSVVTYYAGLKTVDFIVEGIDRSKGVMIVTSRPEEVSSALIQEFGCGTTKIEAKGGFTNKDMALVYFVVNRFQIARMKNLVHRIDSKAYLTIHEVADVFKGE